MIRWRGVVLFLVLSACSSSAPSDTGAACDTLTGQGCLCSASGPACPVNVDICASYPASNPKGFCSHPCASQADCPYTPPDGGTPFPGDCLWVLDTADGGVQGCGIRCGPNRTCPASFVALDVQAAGGQAPFCACVPM